MKEIGEKLKTAREEIGISLEEASTDLKIDEEQLNNLEMGNVDSFKDIINVKYLIRDYAKYLGLDVEKVIDEFNEYMFEYTSKIPLDKIEQAAYEREQEERQEQTEEVKAISPYLMPQEKKSNKRLIITIIGIFILVALTLVWAIKQVMLG